MSALAGIWNLNGRPVPEIEINAFSAHLSIEESENCPAAAPAPGLVLLSRVLRFDRFSLTEQQPHLFGRGSVMTWDGRLDNRDDLLLALHRDLGDNETDVAIVAASYARWGLNALRRLLGDWSLAVWDSATDSLVLARDYMGNRPFYYRETPNCFAWATRLDALAGFFRLYGEPDESYICGKLTSGTTPGLTPYRSVRALRAGHFMVVSATGPTSPRRYWTYTPATIRYRDQGSYSDHLRELLIESVRLRLRANRTVWAHLSGGLDSSSVVCLANRLIQRGCVEAPNLQPISLVSSDSLESDESRFIHAVERWCGLQSTRREFPGMPTLADLVGVRHPFAVPSPFALEWPVQRAGDSIVLTGGLGDVVMMQSPGFSMLEPLYEGRPFQVLQLALSRARHTGRPVLQSLVRMAITAYVPERIRQPFTGRPFRPSADHGVPPALLAFKPVRERMPVPSVADFATVKRPLLNLLYSIADGGALTSSDAYPHVWRTSPYAHRPLVEFVLAVPHLALWAPDVTRAGMKRALADILPLEILTRSTKGNPAAVLTRARLQQVASLLSSDEVKAHNWELVRRGYVERSTLVRAFEELRIGSKRETTPLMSKWLPLEAWLRTLAILASNTAVQQAQRQQWAGPGRPLPLQAMELRCRARHVT